MEKGKTLKDIARKLNMSISTVSKALNNDISISTLTKERVQQQAREWNYVPNESARNFKLNKSSTLGLIIPDLLDPFYVLAINGIEEIASKENYNLILTQSHEDIIKEENIVNIMIRSRVDGVILAITKNTVDMSFLEKFKLVGIPVMCIVREPQNHSCNYVSLNNKHGAFQATRHLIKRGHTRIAHIMGPETLQISQVRFEGYKQAMEKYNLPLDNQLVKKVDFSRKDTEKAMSELMKLENPPTAIFTFKNDITLDAIGFLKRKYPTKLDFIDFTDFGILPLFDYLDHKPVASIEENFYEVGKQAAELLFQMIKGEDHSLNNSPQNVEIPCKLVIQKL
ncbi:MAG TPA: LacI family DNA-binding transcriptional regulator [Hanamia sp.]|nr:LacI family DNA-binding transcriptional regulator [Hanamia sp.]